MKKIFQETDKQWEEAAGFSPFRVASNLVRRRSRPRPPTITSEDGAILQSNIELPEQIDINFLNSYPRQSGGVDDSSRFNPLRNSQLRPSGGIAPSHTINIEISDSSWARDQAEFAQFCAENSIATNDSIYESEDSPPVNIIISESFANMTGYSGYHADEARNLFRRNNTPVSAGGAAQVTGGHTNVGPRQPETPPQLTHMPLIAGLLM